MLENSLDLNLIYQLVFVIILFSLSLMFFVVLVRYTAWLKIHMDRLVELYKRDSHVLSSSIMSLMVIGKSKGMNLFDEDDEESEEEDEDENPQENIRGRYRSYTDV